MYIFCQPSGVACSASRVNSMTIHVPSSTALALGASSIMFATVMTDTSDGHYTSSSFVSFYGLVGIGSTPPVVFAPRASMDHPDWLPCRVGASSYLPDGGYVAGRSVRRGLRAGPAEDRSRILVWRAMIVFLALDSGLALPGRVLLGPKPRRGLRRSQIRGRRVATSSDAVDLKRLTQSDFVQFWINKIDGVAVCGSNPIDGGLSEAHGIRMSRTLRASRAVQTAEFQLVMSSSRDGELSEERRTRLQPAFLGKDPARTAGQKVAHSRACAGHCHCCSGLGVPAASAPEFNTRQARQSKRGHFLPKALQVRRSRSRHPNIRCPRGMTRDRSFRRNLRTPAYGEAVANVRSSRNFPEPKRNWGASSCPFTQRG